MSGGDTIQSPWGCRQATEWLYAGASNHPSSCVDPAGSEAWAGLANVTLVSLLTALIIEIVLTGRYETLFLWGIVAAAWLVCSLIDRARGGP